MRILDPQTAVLTNIEVLAYLTSNPPHRPPSRPPNARQWVPSPDLRDHNTVVKEIHNYVARISPHLLKYPRYTARPTSSQSQSQAAMTRTMRPNATTEVDPSTLPPPVQSTESTPMDHALRELISRLQPYGLTKAEVVTILNLGIGLSGGESDGPAGEVGGDGEMEVDEAPAVNGEGEADGEGEGGEDDGADYGVLALFDSVIEEREDRMSDEDLVAILGIIRETLSENYGS
ncbi:uncharacterized protein N7482_000445 [Penicillium canariense]|uniref:DNA-directed RNA polymerase III subunit RPC9 n=1 Tax=Penicillium canariense TaxID=189055 RepID=A0A9W9IDD4_9EURO|nr:uncharacterized protein N7482_000445 [Penicillium canariense]KAJ5174568.1 hypothetical protein N7482_000445 [Penicillium canariense]